MALPIIQADDISKVYRLGTLGSGSVKKDIKRWWLKNVAKKESKYFGAVIGEEDSTNHEFWALRNVSFEINEGDVWGIIGSNGAGKSTLLKILSRITKPSSGFIRGRGKISSLLEVGTGFHPDLTGRENIYISGHFLGMTRTDIKKNFDEIVAFSGVEQFIDTPVKRYSSGMYVRLAFAVAAHLDPDILIVDEVLAVGDAEFQKKCMGKMKDVSTNKGRTIIFVSHNMQAVNSLCSKAIWLQSGKIKSTGPAHNVINQYLGAHQRKLWHQEWHAENAPGNDFIKVLSVRLEPDIPELGVPLNITNALTVKFLFQNNLNDINLVAGLHLFTLSGECIFDVSTTPSLFKEGLMEGECSIPGNFLNDGSYYFSIIFVKNTSEPLFYLEECLYFDMEDYRVNTSWFGKWMGYVRPQLPFNLKPHNGTN
ncbi:MAG TPA: ABC transporter ATP-binding protein [Flavitalea sp.]|nr:ABC transporter ATP-binding protein [Flavitalea sp.]